MLRFFVRSRVAAYLLFGMGLLSQLWPGSARAVEVSYVGGIRDGLVAPTSLAASVDQIAALQPYNGQIVVLTPEGVLSQRIDVSLHSHGLARLGANSYLFCEPKAGRVVAVDVTNGRQWTFLDGLSQPADIVVAAGSCHVLEAGRRRIVTTDRDGLVTGQLDLATVPGLSITGPAGLAFDEYRQIFHVFDQLASRAYMLTRAGQLVGTYSDFGNADGEITRGGGMACDGDGYSYVVDRYQGRIAIFDPSGRFASNIDTRSLAGVPMIVPTGIAVDANGIVYVASMEDNTIHVFSVDKAALPASDLAAVPVFPVAAGTMSVADVELVARVVATPAAGNALSADFRIFDAATPDVIVAEAFGIEPMEIGMDDSGRLVGTAAWKPGNVLTAGTVYTWQTRARTDAQVSAWSEPATFSTQPAAVNHNLEANYPNPFNPHTTIAFTVPAVGEVVIEIFDLKGTRIWTKQLENLTAGRHTVGWDARNDSGSEVASGVYFYRLKTEGFEQTRKMVLVR